jgi:hypothetical protein
MYRVLTIVGSGLLLAACTSSSSNWFNLDALKPAPSTENVQFESEPPGADAKTSIGQACRTPCSLALPDDAPFSVTFTLNGYLPETEQVELISDGPGFSKLRPNPVLVELTAAPPVKKVPPVRKKPVARKPAPKPAAAAAPTQPATASAPAPATAATATSPWPTQQPAR